MNKEELNECQKYILNKLIQAPPPLQFPYHPDDKVFKYVDEEGNEIGDPYSYNEWIEKIKSFSCVNEELLGSND